MLRGVIRGKEKPLPKLTIDENYSLNYNRIQGEMDKPCLVFLHEGLGCEAMWGSFPELLCKATGCPGLIYDRLGYGNSFPLGRAHTVHYMHEYALTELPKLLETVCPGTAFILIGHSDGGSISLIYGAARPPLLKGIIAEAAHVLVEPETIARIRSADEAWEKGMLKGLTKYHGDKTETIFKAWSTTWLTNWFKYWNIEYLLPSIEVPLLVIQGINDQYGSADQVHSIVSKSSGKAQLEMIENCGHAPHLEAQLVVLELMSSFIAQI
jgi:pimeloyl-ACP methyl ester carboxylesterase